MDDLVSHLEDVYHVVVVILSRQVVEVVGLQNGRQGLCLTLVRFEKLLHDGAHSTDVVKRVLERQDVLHQQQLNHDGPLGFNRTLDCFECRQQLLGHLALLLDALHDGVDVSARLGVQAVSDFGLVLR